MKDGVFEGAPVARTSAHAVLLGISAAAAALLTLVWIYLPDGISEKDEGRIFVYGSVLVPLAGVVFASLLTWLERRIFAELASALPLLASAHAVFWAVVVRRLHALPPAELRPRVRPLLFVWLGGSLAVLAVLAVYRRWRLPFAARFAPLLVTALERALPFVVGASLVPFVAPTIPAVPYLVVLFLAGFASVFHEDLGRFPAGRAKRFTFDLLVLVGAVLLVVDPRAEPDTFHANYFLGPVAAVRSGRTMLIDVNCQYGVGVIYFIAAMFDRLPKLFPPTLAGFSALLGTLGVVQYAVIYGTLRSITRRPGLAALVFALMLFTPRFEQMAHPSTYPSTGALRFGLGYLLIGIHALRGRFPGGRIWISWLEALVLGVASIWSFESFVYAFVAYLGSLTFEAAHVGWRGVPKLFEERLAPAFLAIAWFMLTLAAYTRWHAGHLPRWGLYTAYLTLYSTGEFGTLPVETWTPWVIVIGIYVVTVVALGYRRIGLGRTDWRAAYSVVFTMSALGIAQYTYFLGRSHVNNLFHIAPPAIFVAGFWFIEMKELASSASRALRSSLVFVGWSAFVFTTLHAIPDFTKKFEHTWLSVMIEGKPWPERGNNPRLNDALALLRKYAPDRRRVAFFTQPDLFVEVSLLNRKSSVWDEAYPSEDGLVPEIRDRLLASDGGLKAGDIVFADTGSAATVDPAAVHLVGQVDHIDRELFNRLVGRYAFDVVEARSTGIVALRLKNR